MRSMEKGGVNGALSTRQRHAARFGGEASRSLVRRAAMTASASASHSASRCCRETMGTAHVARAFVCDAHHASRRPADGATPLRARHRTRGGEHAGGRVVLTRDERLNGSSGAPEQTLQTSSPMTPCRSVTTFDRRQRETHTP